MSVEAKARHREIVEEPPGTVAPGVKGLLRDAARKRGPHPFIVCVDVCLPPEGTSAPPSWAPQVDAELHDVVAGYEKEPFDLVIFTNLPHQYGGPGEPSPICHYHIRRSSTSRVPGDVVKGLAAAVGQHGNVPGEFPDDFDQAI